MDREVQSARDTQRRRRVYLFQEFRARRAGMWLYHACIIPLVTRFSNAAQNVNKVNTKATLRCPIDTPWIPLWARDHLKKTVRSFPF